MIFLITALASLTMSFQVSLPYEMFSRLGSQRALLVRVCPVLLTHGVNEMQSIANSVGDTAVQESINDRKCAECLVLIFSWE